MIKFGDELKVRQLIDLGNKNREYFSSKRRKILQKICPFYFVQDYVHKEAKRIIIRNLTTIISFYEKFKKKHIPESHESKTNQATDLKQKKEIL